jgi:cell division protein ZapA (FtsZ GTPase activity inhibitor)
MPETVPIVIMGQTFHLRGSHDPAYVARVERFLSDRIEAARKVGGAVDSSQVMILVALNLVDDVFSREREIEELHKNIDNRVAELIKLIDSHMGADV